MYEPKLLFQGLLPQNKTIPIYTPKNKALIKQIIITKTSLGSNSYTTPDFSLGLTKKGDPFGICHSFAFTNKFQTGLDNYIFNDKDCILTNCIANGAILTPRTESYTNINAVYPYLNWTQFATNGALTLGTGLTNGGSYICNSSTTAYEVIVKIPPPEGDISKLASLKVRLTARYYYTQATSAFISASVKNKNGTFDSIGNITYSSSTTETPGEMAFTNLSNLDLTKPIEIKITIPGYHQVNSMLVDFLPSSIEIESPPIPLSVIGKTGDVNAIKPNSYCPNSNITRTPFYSIAYDGINFSDYFTDLTTIAEKDVQKAKIKIKLRLGIPDTSIYTPTVIDTSSNYTYSTWLIYPHSDVASKSILSSYKIDSAVQTQIIDTSLPMDNTQVLQLAGFIKDPTSQINIAVTGVEY